MAELTIAAILQGVADTLEGVAGVAKAVTLGDLPEGAPDLPMIKVYPLRGLTDTNERTDRSTFKAGIRNNTIYVVADVFVKTRAKINEDMVAVVTLLDAIYAVLDGMTSSLLFGVSGIRTYNWNWEYVELVNSQNKYAGLTLTFEIIVF